MAKKSEENHRAEVKAMEAHTSSSGCVVRCLSNYEEGKSHSHRFNAAEQARGEPSVYPSNLDNPWTIVGWGSDKLQALQSRGGLAAPISQDSKGRNVTKLKPFHRAFIPFPHNAHHIIPMGVLWQDVIDKVVKKAKTKPGEMFTLVIGAFLTEPYNHNDKPNMITLPTRNKESEKLGLPMHLKGKARNHPKYSKIVASQVKLEVPPKYDDLAAALNAGNCTDDTKDVKVRAALVGISEATYKAIIALAKANATAGQTLDEAASAISQKASSMMAG